MFCSNCGKKISETSKFCDFCGVPQKMVNSEDIKSSKKKIDPAITIIVLLIVFGLIAYVLYKWRFEEIIYGKYGKLNKYEKTQIMKYKATMGIIKVLSLAIELYIVDLGHAPKVDSIRELNSPWFVPFYIKKVPVRDAWFNEFIYKQDGKDKFYICSPGDDGVFQGFNQRGKYVDILTGNDIILHGPGEFGKDRFVYAPEKELIESINNQM